MSCLRYLALPNQAHAVTLSQRIAFLKPSLSPNLSLTFSYNSDFPTTHHRPEQSSPCLFDTLQIRYYRTVSAIRFRYVMQLTPQRPPTSPAARGWSVRRSNAYDKFVFSSALHFTDRPFTYLDGDTIIIILAILPSIAKPQ